VQREGNLKRGRVKVEIEFRGEGGTNSGRRGAEFDIFC